jgi:signal transduction histidine kinase
VRILSAVWWVVAIGRDHDFAPPARWWKGPLWLRWAVAAAALAAWALGGLVAWTQVTDDVLTGMLLVTAQVCVPLLSWHRPLTAVRLSFVAIAVAMVVVRPIGMPAGIVYAWPLDTYLLPFGPVVVTAIARSRSEHAIGLAAVTLALVIGGVLALTTEYSPGIAAGPVTGVFVVLVAGYLLADSRRAREQSSAERDKRAVLQERARIARELHDVIGHHLSMIAVRTDSAPYRLSEVDDEVRAEFAALGAAAREALAEARQLIGVLREDDGDAETGPQPTIDDVAPLVAQAETSGARVRLDMSGSTAGVSAALGLSAYRIVQESLSNALRHSPGTPVDVRMRCTDEEIEVAVDNGPATTRSVAHGPLREGTGLTGIRERAGLLGGSCTAGPRPDGGFRVLVRLPR